MQIEEINIDVIGPPAQACQSGVPVERHLAGGVAIMTLPRHCRDGGF
jgi:hypothetical protein